MVHPSTKTARTDFAFAPLKFASLLSLAHRDKCLCDPNLHCHREKSQTFNEIRLPFLYIIMKHLLTLLLLASTALSSPTPSRTLSAREVKQSQDAKLYMPTYSDKDCKTLSSGGAPIMYTRNNRQKAGIASYQLERDLQPTEQLDFSVNNCEDFLYTAPSGQKAGCYSTTSATQPTCFRLWVHGQ